MRGRTVEDVGVVVVELECLIVYRRCLRGAGVSRRRCMVSIDCYEVNSRSLKNIETDVFRCYMDALHISASGINANVMSAPQH
jgi:hypothetical protein